MADVIMSVTLALIVCDKCGISFGVPKEWQTKKLRDKTKWWCPNGHAWSYTDESDVEKAQRLQREGELRAQAQVNEARHLQLVAEKARDSEVRKRRKIERRMAKGMHCRQGKRSRSRGRFQ